MVFRLLLAFVLTGAANAWSQPAQEYTGRLHKTVVRAADGTEKGVIWVLQGTDGSARAIQADATTAKTLGALTGEVITLNARAKDGLLAPEGTPARQSRAVIFKTALSPAEETVEGRLETLHIDNFEQQVFSETTVVDSGGGQVVELAGGETLAATGRKVKVRARGAKLTGANMMIASEVTVLEDTAAAPVTGTVRTQATYSVLVIPVKFSDTTSTSFSQAGLQTTVFGPDRSVVNYYRENSYGSHQITGTVTQMFTLPYPKPATCTYSTIATDATRLAREAGFTAAYNKYVYVFPGLPCGWQGLGGGSTAWVNNAATLLVLGHELGHTFGMGHSSSLDCGAVPLGPPCSVSEYGDPVSIMGNGRTGHLAINMKRGLQFLTDAQVPVQASGRATYTLHPTESPGGSTYGVRIQVTPTRTLWLEYRQLIGFDSGLGESATNGVRMYIHDYSGGGGLQTYNCTTCAVDLSPATTTFLDGTLQAGQTWTYVDNNYGNTIEVSVTSATATGAAVSVNIVPPADITPVPFNFQTQTGVSPSAGYATSNSVTIAGLSGGAMATITGGYYSFGCSSNSMVSATSIVRNGTVLCMKHLPSPQAGGSKISTLTVGTYSTTFTTVTAGGTSTGTEPVISRNLSPLTLIETQSGALAWTVTSATPVTYAWYKNGQVINGQTGSTLSLSQVTSAAAGNYYSRATNAGGSVSSATVAVTVTPLVTITIQPQGGALSDGQAYTLSVAYQTATSATVQWFKNGTALAGRTGNTLAFTAVTAADAGTYQARVTAGAPTGGQSRTVNSANAVITITAPPPPVTPWKQAVEQFRIDMDGGFR